MAENSSFIDLYLQFSLSCLQQLRLRRGWELAKDEGKERPQASNDLNFNEFIGIVLFEFGHNGGHNLLNFA